MSPGLAHPPPDMDGWGGQDAPYRSSGTTMLQQERRQDQSSALGGCSGTRWEGGEGRKELIFFYIGDI